VAESANSDMRLGVAAAAFLDVCVEPSYRRLVIEDAPAVLGAARCREIEDATVFGAMVAALMARHKAGRFEVPDPKLAGRMIASILCEAALQLPEAKNPKQMRAHTLAIVATVLSAFDPGASGK